MLVIHAQHIWDQLRLPFCYLVLVCWGKRSFLQSFCEPQEFIYSEKAAGKYIHVPMHIWMAQDITAQVANAFDCRQINSCPSWASSCTMINLINHLINDHSLISQGAPQPLFLSCGHLLCWYQCYPGPHGCLCYHKINERFEEVKYPIIYLCQKRLTNEETALDST